MNTDKFFLSILSLLLLTTAATALPVEQAYRDMKAYRIEKSFPVQNLTITRDAATFELRSGKIDLIEPIDGRYHTAVFRGEGLLTFRPPNAVERDQLFKFTGVRILEEKFQTIVFKFTDDTAKEFKAEAQSANSQRVESKESREVRGKLLKGFYKNVDSRTLRDFYSGSGGYFLAYVYGASKGEFLIEIDPEEKEPVAIAARGPMNFIDVWSNFASQNITPSLDPIQVPHFEVDMEIDKKGKVESKATLEVVPQTDSVKSFKLNISSLIEMVSITDDQGKPCIFIHEVAEDRVGEPALKQNTLDIFLPEPFAKGAKRKLEFRYKSEELIERIGSSNDYLIRDTTGWYPSAGYLQRSTSKITYHYPEDLQLLAVGEKVSESKADKKTTSVWEQKTPVAFVCFTMGEFKHENVKVEGLPNADIFSGKRHSGFRLGGDPLHNVAADVVNSIHYFESIYSKYPFQQILVTEIPANHGQGFPGFLHLSVNTFEDAGLSGVDEAFRAHEVSHQWWGHLVGWDSYRDQWLSEGFAEFSGALYSSAASKDKDLMLKMVESWKSDILNKGSLRRQRYGAPKLSGNATMGTESGPIWLGTRLSSSKSPVDYQILVYSKGAYVLHMLRMMMRDFQGNNDDAFFEMMKDFVEVNSWKNATTEGFQKIAEKHYGKPLQWFFDQWVYGTRVPKYQFRWRVETDDANKLSLVCDVQQTNVPDGFQMPVPIFVDFGKGRFAIDRLLIDEPSKTIRIPLPEKPKNVIFNYYRSVLAYD